MRYVMVTKLRRNAAQILQSTVTGCHIVSVSHGSTSGAEELAYGGITRKQD